MKNITKTFFFIFSLLLVFFLSANSFAEVKVPEEFEVIVLTKDIPLTGDGIIKAGEEMVKVNSVSEEYIYLTNKLGIKSKDWERTFQHLISDTAGKYYDVLTVKIFSTNEVKDFYFDISSFFNN